MSAFLDCSYGVFPMNLLCFFIAHRVRANQYLGLGVVEGVRFPTVSILCFGRFKNGAEMCFVFWSIASCVNRCYYSAD